MRGADAHDAPRLKEQAEWLFDPDRMARRLFTLERICLASVAAQTDPDFRFLVVTSARLPQVWRDRLSQLCAGLPQAELILSDSPDLAGVLRPILMRSARQTGRAALQFRLDDDDAVGPGFVADLRRIGTATAALPEHAISFPRGLSVMCYGDNPPSFWKTWRPLPARPWRCGWPIPASRSSRTTISTCRARCWPSPSLGPRAIS
ncbi:glycosyltransferase [Paracoccus aerius]